MDKSAWRWFPHGLILSMLLVFAVNAWFVVVSLRSFPGAAGTDGFDLSNGYDRVLAAAAAQAALGWHVEATLDDAAHPVLRVVDRSGAPLQAAVIEARAERPIGPTDDTILTFRPAGSDRYRADATLAAGQWDVLLTVHSAGRSYSTTQRLIAH